MLSPLGTLEMFTQDLLVNVWDYAIKKLIVSSNKNDILTRFFPSGEMKKKKLVNLLAPVWIFKFLVILKD